jgi:hypothetical protein
MTFVLLELLVTLTVRLDAETIGITRIATLDVADFSIYRIHGRKRFELELLR